ncbi:MAG TPA: YggT family protein [Savagea sp.]
MQTIANIVGLAFQIYFFLIIIYVLMSWIPGLRESSFGELVEKVVEPYLGIFRSIIPPLGMIDFSPIVALLALNLIQSGVYTILDWISRML